MKRRPGEDPEPISELKSLGPKSQEMLACVGISTQAQLRELGSVAAYARVKRANGKASLNLLWALESALSGEPWQQVARLHRGSLLLALEEYERRAGMHGPTGRRGRSSASHNH